MSASPDIIEQARSSDPDARQKAAYAVSHALEDRDYPLMFELLGDKDWRVRKTIVDGFVGDASADVVERLVAGLSDGGIRGARNPRTKPWMGTAQTRTPRPPPRFPNASSVHAPLDL